MDKLGLRLELIFVCLLLPLMAMIWAKNYLNGFLIDICSDDEPFQMVQPLDNVPAAEPVEAT